MRVEKCSAELTPFLFSGPVEHVVALLLYYATVFCAKCSVANANQPQRKFQFILFLQVKVAALSRLCRR